MNFDIGAVRAQLIRQRHTHVVVAPGDDKAGAFSSGSGGAANPCERAGNQDDWGAHIPNPRNCFALPAEYGRVFLA